MDTSYHELYQQHRLNHEASKIRLINATIKNLIAGKQTPSDLVFDTLEEYAHSITDRLYDIHTVQELQRLRKALEMYRFYRTGKTLAELGDWYGVSRQYIHKTFKKYGFPMRPVHPISVEQE